MFSWHCKVQTYIILVQCKCCTHNLTIDSVNTNAHGVSAKKIEDIRFSIEPALCLTYMRIHQFNHCWTADKYVQPLASYLYEDVYIPSRHYGAVSLPGPTSSSCSYVTLRRESCQHTGTRLSIPWSRTQQNKAFGMKFGTQYWVHIASSSTTR